MLSFWAKRCRFADVAVVPISTPHPLLKKKANPVLTDPAAAVRRSRRYNRVRRCVCHIDDKAEAWSQRRLCRSGGRPDRSPCPSDPR